MTPENKTSGESGSGAHSETLSRRKLLTPGRLAAAASVAALAGSAAARRASTGTTKLTVMYLRGGLDPLALLGPYDNVLYPTIRDFTLMKPPSDSSTPPPDEALHFGTFQGDNFGIPQLCASMRNIWRTGDLAVVMQAGSLLTSQSHFSKQDAMETGTTDDCTLFDGWLARYMGVADPGFLSPRAVALSTLRPLSLRDAAKTVVTPDLETFAFPAPAGMPNDVEYEDAVADMYGTGPLASVASSTFDALGLPPAADFPNYAPSAGVTYPNSPLGKKMKNIAAMFSAPYTGVNYCPEIAHVDVGSFDTHSNQDMFSGDMDSFGLLLQDMWDSVAAYHFDMQGKGVDHVLVMMSEFGRTVKENGSNGTDHGKGGAMFVVGQDVKGGSWYGDWLGLDQSILDADDFAVVADYRQVLAEVLVKKMLMAPTELDFVFPPDVGGQSCFTYAPLDVLF